MYGGWRKCCLMIWIYLPLLLLFIAAGNAAVLAHKHLYTNTANTRHVRLLYGDQREDLICWGFIFSLHLSSWFSSPERDARVVLCFSLMFMNCNLSIQKCTFSMPVMCLKTSLHFVCVLTALQVFQKGSQLRKEIELHKAEPQCSGGQKQLALQTGTWGSADTLKSA